MPWVNWEPWNKGQFLTHSEAKSSEFGAEEALSESHARRCMTHAQEKNPEISEDFQQSILQAKWGRGVVQFSSV